MGRWRVSPLIVLGAFAGLALMPCSGTAEEAVRLHAAGSLRGALTEMAEAFTRAYGIILSREGQEILARQGFAAPTKPAP